MSYPFPWGPPPPGYIPGLGRGAVGFVSSIEKGAVTLESDAVIKSKKALEKMREEDDKADEFYRSIEEKMKSRNKEKKRMKEKNEKTVFSEVTDSFADLKQGLASISANDWENLPEIGATTYHRPKWDLYTYASDRTITHDFEQSALNKSIQDSEEEKVLAAARAQRSVMNAQLSRILPEQNSIDISSFMQELDHQASATFDQFTDLDRAAELYRSMTHADQNDAQGWLLRERIEERRGRLSEARRIAKKGMICCPGSDLLVMEAARLSTRSEAIALLESALKVNHRKNEKLWLQLISYQRNDTAKKATLEAALREVPESEELWRATAKFQSREEHVETLKHATSMVPHSVALWMDGIRSSLSLEEGKQFLENGIANVGENADMYVTMAQLCEKFEDADGVADHCRSAYMADTQRDWIVVAQKAENSGYRQTAEMIVKVLPFNGSFLDQAYVCEARKSYTTAGALLARYAEERTQYKDLLVFRMKHGNVAEWIDRILEEHLENEEVLQEICSVVGVEESIAILERAVASAEKSERLILLFANALLENREIDKARDLMREKQQIMPHSVGISLKLAEIEEQYGGDADLLRSCCDRFPWVPEFWILLCNHTDQNKLELLKSAILHCKSSPIIHLELIKEASYLLPRPRIRALFERARNDCGSKSVIWIHWAEFEPPENRISLLEEAKSAVKDYPGLIWARQIELYTPEMRINLTKSAMETTGNQQELALLMALCLWKSGAVDTARTALENLNTEFPTWADGWIFRLKFEQSYGDFDEIFKHVANLRMESGFIWTKKRSETCSSQSDLLLEIVESVPDPISTDCSMFLDTLDLYRH